VREHVAYKGMMLDGVPNMAFAIGYTNNSWTLKVDLVANISGLSPTDAEKLVHAADQVCPYSNAIRGNVEVGITVNAV